MRKLVFVALSAAVAGCTQAPDAPAESATVAMTPGAEHVAAPLTPVQQEGKVIFETVCWTCHGAAARGDGPAVQAGSVTPPPSFHTRDYMLASPATLERRFRTGMQDADPSHPHMQYVASLLRPESFTAALSYIQALTYPVEIPGSAINGERIFQFRCAGCHGADGRGNGPGAANLVDVKPADFTTDTLVASADWDAVFAKVRAGGQRIHGSAMPAWGIILSDADIWDLVAYLSTFQPGLVAEPRWLN